MLYIWVGIAKIQQQNAQWNMNTKRIAKHEKIICQNITLKSQELKRILASNTTVTQYTMEVIANKIRKLNIWIKD